MRHVIQSALGAVTLFGCHPEMPELPTDERPPIQTTADEIGDSNGDGIEDALQSFLFGYEDNGQPFFVVLNGPGLPAVTTNLWVVGYGGGVYEPESENTWFDPWAPMVPYIVDGVTIGYAFRNIRDAKYEIVVVDANSFEPYEGEGWGNLELGLTPWDDTRFVVTHVDGASCPSGGRESTHFLFAVQNRFIAPLTQGLAPPDEACLVE